jgi:hypothetical protein
VDFGLSTALYIDVQTNAFRGQAFPAYLTSATTSNLNSCYAFSSFPNLIGELYINKNKKSRRI